ncbi:unnamed protein product [Prunus brigantina]
MAAMDRFSSELRTLFQERMPASASMTPPGAGQRSQEGERIEPYGEGSSHGTPARAPTSGYGQNFQPPTNGWGQSQPTWANSGPARLSEMTYSPLHALAVTLGQNTPMNSTAQHGGPVHTLAVHTHPGTSHPPAVSSQQYGQGNPIISSLLTPPFPPDSHPHFGAGSVTTPYAHLGQTQGANMAPTGPTGTTEVPTQAAQQQRPQNDGQQNQRPTAAQTEAPARGLRFEDVRRMIEDGLAQRRPEAPRYTKPYPPEIDRTPLPRNYRLPEFTLFSGDGHTSFIEHIGRFTAQCGEANSDALKLRLFVHSLTGAAFSWFINLPPNSVRDWSDMERTFHEHFY